MPNGRFYIRNHFQIPNLNAAHYRLAVGGLVRRNLSLSLRDLMQMPSQTFFATLECAGKRQRGQFLERGKTQRPKLAQ